MKKLSKILILSVLSLAALAACKKKESGGSGEPEVIACTPSSSMAAGQYCNNGVVAPAQPCPNGQTQPGYICTNGYLIPFNLSGGGNILSNVQFANSYMQGAMNLSGGGSFDFTNPRIAYTYIGTVSVAGILEVKNQTLCGAPPGLYSVMGSGNMAYGAINNMMLTLAGPASMQWQISSAVLSNSSTGLDRNSSENRFGVLNSGLTVNGQPCGTLTTY